MDIGTGIAIAGVWMFAGVVILGGSSNSAGWISIFIASGLTTVFLTFFG